LRKEQGKGFHKEKIGDKRRNNARNTRRKNRRTKKQIINKKGRINE